MTVYFEPCDGGVMTVYFEIFDNLESINTHDSSINNLFGYPNAETKTVTYRKPYKHPVEDLWRGTIKDDLVEACGNMTPEERANYYDPSELVTYQYLLDNGWFIDE